MTTVLLVLLVIALVVVGGRRPSVPAPRQTPRVVRRAPGPMVTLDALHPLDRAAFTEALYRLQHPNALED